MNKQEHQSEASQPPRTFFGSRVIVIGEHQHVSQDYIIAAASELQSICHGVAKVSGWWNQADPMTSIENPLHFSNKLCLIHSEISEAMEGDRKKLKDDKLPHRDMREVELADAVIRIFDLAGGYGLDIAGAIAEKLAYNQSRADHKPENRAKDGGKAY